VVKAQPDQAIYAAMLTPQGKFMFDMFVLAPEPETFWLDVSRPQAFAQRLGMYRLRSKVVIEDCSAFMGVYAGKLDGNKTQSTAPYDLIFQDPRLADLGQRAFGLVTSENGGDTYLTHRLTLGVPDPAEDLLVEKDFALEGLLDEMGGVDFHKGCYVGQEMTSRMKRRTSIKNKLCRVRFEGDAPDFDTPILADDWEVGRMRSGVNGVAIALIRFDRARKAIEAGQPLLAGGTPISLDPPVWLIEPEVTS
jgi:tRNA-modifying protein YgfZ